MPHYQYLDSDYADPCAPLSSLSLTAPRLFAPSSRATLYLRHAASYAAPICVFGNIAPALVCALQRANTTLVALPRTSTSPPVSFEMCAAPLSDTFILRLRFGKGGNKLFYASIKRAFQAKASSVCRS